MRSFVYYTPTEVIFGSESVNQTSAMIQKSGGKKVLVVFGGGSALRSGLLGQIEKQLEENQIPYELLGGVSPNPDFDLVEEGVILARMAECDFILAVGGGSVIDTAKGIAYGLEYDGEDLWDLWDRKAQAKGAAPVGAVLTIAAAGSEMSDSCVLTRHGVKRGYSSNYGRCRFAILDPALTLTLPMYPTMCGCADILMHTLERYLSGGSHMQITDEISEGLMRTVMDQSLVLRHNLRDLNARAEMMWSSSLSHNGLTECGTVKDFTCHTLGHELSGAYGVAHGASLTALWPSWARYVYKNDLPRFVRLARTVIGASGKDEDALARAGIDAMVHFFRQLDMPVSLEQLGLDLSDEDLKKLAASAARACGGHKGSAMVLDENDFYNIYRLARQS